MTTFDARVAYLYSSVAGYVRSRKSLTVLAKLFPEVHFIGLKRRNTRDINRPEKVRVHMCDENVSYGVRTAFGILRYFRFARRKLEEIRPDIVIAVNDETVLPFLAGYLPRPKHLVLDQWDSISMRIVGPARRLNRLLRVYTNYAVPRVDAYIDVCPERLALLPRKPEISTVIYNAPYFIDKITPRTDLPENFVFVNGTLSDRNFGMENLLAAVEMTPGMKIVTAGRYDGPFVTGTFLEHPDVIDLGEIPHQEIFPVAAACRAIYAHVAPTIPIYLFGSANKHFEAMMMAKPLLINSENRASRMYVEMGFGIATPYNDPSALAAELAKLMQEDPAREQACRKARAVFRDRYSWDRMEQRWESLFHRLGLPRR